MNRAFVITGLSGLTLAASGCSGTGSEDSSTAALSISFPVQSATWARSTGEAVAACTPLNPFEVSFGNVATDGGPGVQLKSASNTPACCGCIARVASFALGATVITDNAAMSGWIDFVRGATDTYSLASMRVDLMAQGTEVAHATFAAEHRANDNCAFETEILLPNAAAFDISLSSIAAGTSFDTLQILLQGYGCTTATESVTLSNLQATCTPAACSVGSCGSFADHCGGTLSCTCTPPEVCGGSGVPNQCAVPPVDAGMDAGSDAGADASGAADTGGAFDGSSDASPEPDASPPAPDAGGFDAGPNELVFRVGCGCSTAPSSVLTVLWFVPAAWARRRRRPISRSPVRFRPVLSGSPASSRLGDGSVSSPRPNRDYRRGPGS